MPVNDVVRGHWDSRFDKLAGAFAQAITDGEEVGAAIAIDIDGEYVVDIWGGHADAAGSRPWDEHTIVNVWSSTKTVTALAALILIDRGLLDPFAPVAEYWPEFAANGKQHIEVRHVLSHTSGVSGWEAPFTFDDLYDYDKATAQLAGQAPWWPPGTASGYHMLNLGHLIGEMVRRVADMSLKDFVRQEIAEPLDADFQIGACPEDDDRIADLLPPPPLELPLHLLAPGSPMLKTFSAPVTDADMAALANSTPWRRAEIGAANGHGNARSLARALSPVSLGGKANGVQLLHPATIELIFQEQSNGVDLVLGAPLRWGIGFGLPQRDTFPYLPDERICFWGGFGGSMIAMHPDRRTTVAYVMNKMGAGLFGSERTTRYATLIYEALA